jgi:aryl-alcohol dehydrogenase-like predicted oxidoreductase
MNPLRSLGKTSLRISSVGLGLWPISGISSLNVNDSDSMATIQAALDSGINFFDTAYSYGYDGCSDRLLAQAISGNRNQIVVATKVGTHYDSHRQRIIDGRPEILIQHARESIERLKIDKADIMYLHIPDPKVPLDESASAIAEIVDRGLAKFAGVSNVTLQQLQLFHQICPVAVVQPHFNMLQMDQVIQIRNFCHAQSISIACYWVLMKGLLAGKMPRDHQLDPEDRRRGYDIYQGQAWHRAQDLLDHLRKLAAERHCTVAQLVVAWTIAQPGISSALCGAKRAEQITETAQAMSLEISKSDLEQIDHWIENVAQRPEL